MTTEHDGEQADANCLDYQLIYFDQVRAESRLVDEPPTAAFTDGGPSMRGSGPSTFSLAMETRERVAAVEQSVESIEGSVNRIEDTVDEVADEVSNVEDSAMHEERFEDQYKEKILRNWKLWTLVKWLTAFIVPLIMLLGVLVEAGVIL